MRKDGARECLADINRPMWVLLGVTGSYNQASKNVLYMIDCSQKHLPWMQGKECHCLLPGRNFEGKWNPPSQGWAATAVPGTQDKGYSRNLGLISNTVQLESPTVYGPCPMDQVCVAVP